MTCLENEFSLTAGRHELLVMRQEAHDSWDKEVYCGGGGWSVAGSSAAVSLNLIASLTPTGTRGGGRCGL